LQEVRLSSRIRHTRLFPLPLEWPMRAGRDFGRLQRGGGGERRTRSMGNRQRRVVGSIDDAANFVGVQALLPDDGLTWVGNDLFGVHDNDRW
jgi:hypothetical protein